MFVFYVSPSVDYLHRCSKHLDDLRAASSRRPSSVACPARARMSKRPRRDAPLQASKRSNIRSFKVMDVVHVQACLRSGSASIT